MADKDSSNSSPPKRITYYKKDTLILANRFKLLKKLGEGSFGVVYKASLDDGKEVAIKLENAACKHPMLGNEKRMYEALKDGPGIPKFRWFGRYANVNILAIELLGPSLSQLFQCCAYEFSLKTTLMLADQMLSTVEYIHGKNWIHRDLKPRNFVMGIGLKHLKVFLIDFGLAKTYRDPITGAHIPHNSTKGPVGTASYISINGHYGHEQSRRDDLESLGYVLVRFLRGRLPWENVSELNRRQRFGYVKEMKLALPLESMCSALPTEFITYLKYCRNLGFQEEPDYAYLRSLFANLFEQMKYKRDYCYDWANMKHGYNALAAYGIMPMSSVVPQGQTDAYKEQQQGSSDDSVVKVTTTINLNHFDETETESTESSSSCDSSCSYESNEKGEEMENQQVAVPIEVDDFENDADDEGE